MAILMRGGSYADFDRSKLKPREWAVVLSDDPTGRNGRAVYLCFGNGDVRQMATYQDASDIILNATEDIRQEFIAMSDEILAQINVLKNTIEGYKDTAVAKASEASNSASAASINADLSRSYAVGTGNTVREGDETDNAKSYSEQSKASAQEAGAYLEKAEQSADEAVNRINAVLSSSQFEFSVDMDTGHLMYSGSWIE